jgi:hypothetical protein
MIGLLLMGERQYYPPSPTAIDLRTCAMNRRTWFMMQFAVGLAISIVAALMMFCQERCFLGLDLEFWPVVLGIFGIGVIATSIVPLLPHA